MKNEFIILIKAKFPELLNTLFHSLVKPETQQGILLKFVKDANEAFKKEENKLPRPPGTPLKQKKYEASDFESHCGFMVLELIEMMPKGALEIFHDLSVVKNAIEAEGGKFIGDNLSSALYNTSIVKLFDSMLELAITSSFPKGVWDENTLEFKPMMDPLPMNPMEVEEVKEKQTSRNKQITKDLQKELTEFMENEIARPINASLKEAGEAFMDGVKALIENIFSEEKAVTVFKMFENFANNVYDLFAAIVNLIASVTFWPIARLFIGSMPEDISKTVSLEAHENLLFQWVNIVMSTLEEELERAPEGRHLS
jgi:hypothetical protein